MTTLQETATTNVRDIVHKAIEHETNKNMLVVFDEQSRLAQVLSVAYRTAFADDAHFLEFNQENKQAVLDAFESMSEGDLVVLVQSEDFRLDEFRIRLHLFNKGIKVVEHRHLARNAESADETYINALEYDPEWYRGEGHKLKERLAQTEKVEIHCGDQVLTVTGGLEDPKPNLGDYRKMKNVGGTFPIGEVFTEARDLHSVNGSLMIYSFADVNFNIAMHEPFRIDIEDGIVVGWGDNTPQSFVDVIEKIKTNERPIMREIGFGMNRAITRKHYLNDITAFERILGLHVSLGEKHTIYKKEGITAKKTRFHVDLFLDTTRVIADGKVLFENGTYILNDSNA